MAFCNLLWCIWMEINKLRYEETSFSFFVLSNSFFFSSRSRRQFIFRYAPRWVIAYKFSTSSVFHNCIWRPLSLSQFLGKLLLAIDTKLTPMVLSHLLIMPVLVVFLEMLKAFSWVGLPTTWMSRAIDAEIWQLLRQLGWLGFDVGLIYGWKQIHCLWFIISPILIWFLGGFASLGLLVNCIFLSPIYIGRGTHC